MESIEACVSWGEGSHTSATFHFISQCSLLCCKLVLEWPFKKHPRSCQLSRSGVCLKYILALSLAVQFRYIPEEFEILALHFLPLHDSSSAL